MNIRFNPTRHRLALLHAARYWNVALRHLTPARGLNLALNQIERALGRKRLQSAPPMVKVEAALPCNIACPGCFQVMGRKRGELLGREFLDPGALDGFLSSLGGRSFGVNLAYRGEPMVHPRIIELIRTVKRHRMAAFFPTNLSVERDDSFFEELVDSGLDCLSVSLDGASRETYAQYRRGGNFDLVLANVAKIASIRSQKRSRTPHLRWKFILFEHNRHELGVVEETYRSRGFDSFEIDYDRNSALHSQGRRIRNERLAEGREVCFLPWTTLVAMWNGKAHPCFNEEAEFDLGNLFGKDYRDIWNGPGYVKLRSGLTGRSEDAKPPSCQACIGQC